MFSRVLGFRRQCFRNLTFDSDHEPRKTSFVRIARRFHSYDGRQIGRNWSFLMRMRSPILTTTQQLTHLHDAIRAHASDVRFQTFVLPYLHPHQFQGPAFAEFRDVHRHM